MVVIRSSGFSEKTEWESSKYASSICLEKGIPIDDLLLVVGILDVSMSGKAL